MNTVALIFLMLLFAIIVIGFIVQLFNAFIKRETMMLLIIGLVFGTISMVAFKLLGNIGLYIVFSLLSIFVCVLMYFGWWLPLKDKQANLLQERYLQELANSKEVCQEESERHERVLKMIYEETEPKYRKYRKYRS